jgi:Na+/H+ antiporter NhaD/arsenite permease-like protein
MTPLAIPLEFVLFGITLLSVALFHRHTLSIAVGGLAAIVLYKFLGPGFAAGPGLEGFIDHVIHEWATLANLICLLLGFALIARHFEESRLPALLPRYLPNDWTGGLVLLVTVFVISGFLDNIAAALIGGAMAHALFRARVHIGYLCALVAAANAGGSGSVVGDTTTTMMWISGVDAAHVFPAYIAAIVALVVFGIPASLQQHRYEPIVKDAATDLRIDWARLVIVAWVLVCAVGANVALSTRFPGISGGFPVLGAAVILALAISVPLRRPDWRIAPTALRGGLFLSALVAAASLMPVDALPAPSWHGALGLGFVSAVFDNIPLTALALRQGGYDWAHVAYAVGFGGSMIWFGSSAGVALSALFPEAKSTRNWLRHGWHVAVAYVIGFTALLMVIGWEPETLDQMALRD